MTTIVGHKMEQQYRAYIGETTRNDDGTLTVTVSDHANGVYAGRVRNGLGQYV